MTTPDAERTGTVYTLSDPRNGLIRYVGSTLVKPKTRLTSHLATSTSLHLGRLRTTPVLVWIRELTSADLRPEITPICRVGESDLREVEYAKIDSHFMDGWPLLNVEGVPRHIRGSADHHLLPAFKRRIDRLRPIGGDLLKEALELQRCVEEGVARVAARGFDARLWQELRYPQTSDLWPQAIAFHIDDWTSKASSGDQRPLDDFERARLTNALISMATAGRRHGVSFQVIVDGTGPRIFEQMRPRTNWLAWPGGRAA